MYKFLSRKKYDFRKTRACSCLGINQIIQYCLQIGPNRQTGFTAKFIIIFLIRRIGGLVEARLYRCCSRSPDSRILVKKFTFYTKSKSLYGFVWLYKKTPGDSEQKKHRIWKGKAAALFYLFHSSGHNCKRNKRPSSNSLTSEPVFVNLLRSRGIDFQPCAGRYDNPIWRAGPPAHIGRRNRFLGIDSWAPRNVYKYGLWPAGQNRPAEWIHRFLGVESWAP